MEMRASSCRERTSSTAVEGHGQYPLLTPTPFIQMDEQQHALWDMMLVILILGVIMVHTSTTFIQMYYRTLFILILEIIMGLVKAYVMSQQ